MHVCVLFSKEDRENIFHKIYHQVKDDNSFCLKRYDKDHFTVSYFNDYIQFFEVDSFVKDNARSYRFNLAYYPSKEIGNEEMMLKLHNKWNCVKRRGIFYIVNGKTQLHRFLLDCKSDKVIDHINGDTLDNRKKNLRICTQNENAKNRKISIKNKSGCTGVYWNSDLNKWCANITVDYKNIILGYFTSYDKAVKVRKEAQDKYYGDFSRKDEIIAYINKE